MSSNNDRFQTTYQSSYGRTPANPPPASPSGIQVSLLPGLSPFSDGARATGPGSTPPLAAPAASPKPNLNLPPMARPALPSQASLRTAQKDLSDDEALAIALSKAHADEEAERRRDAHREEQRALQAAIAESKKTAPATAQIDLTPPSVSGLSLIYPSVGPDFFVSRDSYLEERISRLPSLALKPRVNSKDLPKEDYVDTDRGRLLARLKEYCLIEREVTGDGACQFRSLSDQLYGTPDFHDVVRAAVVEQLQQNATTYEAYVPLPYKQYVADMAKPYTWGDHVTLKAAADVYGVRIVVLTSYKESFVQAIEPAVKRSDRFLWLSFWAEVHYNSLYPAEEPPPHLDAIQENMTANSDLDFAATARSPPLEFGQAMLLGAQKMVGGVTGGVQTVAGGVQRVAVGGAQKVVDGVQTMTDGVQRVAVDSVQAVAGGVHKVGDYLHVPR